MIQQQAFELDRAGLTLRGMTYRPASPGNPGRHPTAVFLHGFTGQRIEAGFMFVQLARTLAKHGIAAVTFDFLHSGESDGSFDQMLVTGEVADAVHVSQWVQSQPFVDRSRMGLLGFSLGGLVAGCTLGKVDHYRAAALLAPTTVDNLCRYAKERGGEDGQVTVGPYTLHPDFFTDLRSLDPVTDIARTPRPTLIVQGTGDTAVPPTVSQVYADAITQAGGQLNYVSITDADHVFNKPRARKQAIDAVMAHFSAELRG